MERRWLQGCLWGLTRPDASSRSPGSRELPVTAQSGSERLLKRTQITTEIPAGPWPRSPFCSLLQTPDQTAEALQGNFPWGEPRLPGAAQAGPNSQHAFISMQITSSRHLGATGQLLHSSQRTRKPSSLKTKCSFSLRTPGVEGAEVHVQPVHSPGGHKPEKEQVPKDRSSPAQRGTVIFCQHFSPWGAQAIVRARTT